MTNRITCISLWQPHASLIAARVKVHETRAWPFPPLYAGRRIAIHAAAQGPILGDLDYRLTRLCRETFGADWARTLPFGAFVATATLESQLPTTQARPLGDIDRLCGDWSPGRWAWLLREVVPIEPPVRAPGHQRWWSILEDDLLWAQGKGAAPKDRPSPS